MTMAAVAAAACCRLLLPPLQWRRRRCNLDAFPDFMGGLFGKLQVSQFLYVFRGDTSVTTSTALCRCGAGEKKYR